MAIKICFNDQIHRFCQIPSDFKALISVITSTFSDQLPESWNIYYLTSTGNKIPISHDQNYQGLVEDKSRDPSMSLKLYVEAKEAPRTSYTSIHEQISETKTNSKQGVQDHQLAQPDEVDIKLVSSQYIREKTAEADYYNHQPGLVQQQLNEVEPRAGPQPLDEGNVVEIDISANIEKAISKNKRQMIHKVLQLFKKLSRQELSEDQKTELLATLKEVEESLPAEDRAEYEVKKEKWSMRQLNPQSALEHKQQKQLNHKAKQLFKELRNKNLSESDKAQVLSQLKELEKELSPEQRMKFEQKRERWAHNIGVKLKKQFNIFKIFKMFNKMSETVQKGDAQKINRIREKTLKKIPDEETKKILEPVFEIMMSETSNQETFEKLLDQAREQLMSIYHPQDKDRVIPEWQKAQQERRKRRENKRPGVNSEEMEVKAKGKEKSLVKYSPEIMEKVLKMRNPS